jgi:hypothetical protein
MKDVVCIVKPDTILVWPRRLERKKWDYGARRRCRLGRFRTPPDIEALVCRLARENVWGYRSLLGARGACLTAHRPPECRDLRVREELALDGTSRGRAPRGLGVAANPQAMVADSCRGRNRRLTI